MNIIITGADGFVGTNLILQLIQTSHKMLLIGKDMSEVKELVGSEHVCLSYEGLSQEMLSESFMQFNPDTIMHLAAYSTASDAYVDMEILFNANLLYLGKILDALKNTKIQNFIYTGSFAEFYKGDGVFDAAYLYTATKTAGRSIVKYYSESYGFKYFSICPYTVYGGVDKNKKIIDFLYESLGSSIPIDVSSGEQVLDFIHVNDLADLYISVAEKSDKVPNGALFHAGTGKGSTLKEVVSILEAQSGLIANLNWGGRSYRKRDVMHAVADISLQRSLFNWHPQIDLVKGIEIYLKQKRRLKNEN